MSTVTRESERDNGLKELDQREIDLANELARSAPHEIQKAADPSELIFDVEKFAQMMEFAKVVSQMSVLPKHLTYEKVEGVWKELSAEQKTANCFRVLNQAMRWGVDVFAIIDCTYVVNDRLGYEGKVVAAIVNTKASLIAPLTYDYSGSGRERTVTVIGHIEGEQEPRTVDLVYSKAVTKDGNGNDNLQWSRDPDQKLAYSAVVKWARRHTPEVLMGIFTDDDLDRIAESERNQRRAAKRRSKLPDDQLTSRSSLNDQIDDEPKATETEKTKPKAKAAESKAKQVPPWFDGLESALAKCKSKDDINAVYEARQELCKTEKALDMLDTKCAERQAEISKGE